MASTLTDTALPKLPIATPVTSFAVHELSAWTDPQGLFSKLTFCLSAGELLAVTGPNGVGKSTLLRTLAGLREWQAGQFQYNQQSTTPSALSEAGFIHYVGHLNGLKPNLTPQEQLQFAAAVAGVNIRTSQMSTLLTALGLPFASITTNELSQGQARKLALAPLKLWHAPLWLLDEPFAGLDSAGEDWLVQTCHQHLSAGGLIILTTHQSQPIDRLASKQLDLSTASLKQVKPVEPIKPVESPVSADEARSFAGRWGQILYFDLLAKVKSMRRYLQALLFFILLTCLLPLSLVPDQARLTELAPGLLWILALLASLLSLEEIYLDDKQSGFLIRYLLSPCSLLTVVWAKSMSHWLLTGLLIALISPLLGILLQLQGHVLWVLCASLLLGTPVLTLIGGMGVAMTQGLRDQAVLLPMLMLPLMVPVLIFGSQSVRLAQIGENYWAPMALLAAICFATLALVPPVTSLLLRWTQDY